MFYYSNKKKSINQSFSLLQKIFISLSPVSYKYFKSWRLSFYYVDNEELMFVYRAFNKIYYTYNILKCEFNFLHYTAVIVYETVFKHEDISRRFSYNKFASLN